MNHYWEKRGYEFLVFFLYFRYRDVHFTKNVEKYVKYDLDKVRSLIASVYDVDEKQLVNS